MPASAFLSGQHPFLAERLAVSNHGEGAVEARAAHDPAPEQLAVLRALGLRFEAHHVACHGLRVRSVAVLVAIARSRTKAPVLENDRVGGPFGFSSFEKAAADIACAWSIRVFPS